MHNKPGMIKTILSLLLTVSILIGITPVSAVSLPNAAETSDTESYSSEEFKVPDIIDEEEQAEKSYVGRVKEDEKDLYTFIFKNEDGSNTMRVFDHPVKYVDDKGETRDISLEISKDKDGSFKAADHIMKASFGNDISEGIGLEYDDVRIEMTAKADNNVKAKAGLSADGKKLTYAVDDKTSYVYSLTYCGIKEDIVVNEYTGQTEYEFTLKTNGLHPVKIDESVFLADNYEEIKASIGDIIIFTADNRNNAFGDLQFETVEENNEYKFTIVLDPDYLKDEKTAYPITIDPPITVIGASYIDDVTIGSIGGMESLTSGSLYAGLGNVDGKLRFLMKFKSLSTNSTYLNLSANNIISANICIRDLMCYDDKQIDLSLNSYASGYLPSTWTNGCMSWSSVFTYDNRLTQIGDYLTVFYANGNGSGSDGRQWYSFDATQLVKNWKNGTVENYVAVFRTPTSTETGTPGNYLIFASSDRNSNNPYLTIVYDTTISNGVYAIKNKATGKYIISDTYYANINPSCASVDNPCNSVNSNFDSRSGLFKITNVNDKLIIRTMMSNELFLKPHIASTVNEIVTSSIVYSDNLVQNNEKWGYFRDTSDGYYSIFFYDTSISSSIYYIAAYSDGTVGLTISYTDNCKFSFQRYTGQNFDRIVTRETIPQMVEPYGSFNINSVISSTTIGKNGPAEYALSLVNPDGTYTQRAHIYSVGTYHYITANMYNYHTSFTLIVSYSDFNDLSFDVTIKYYGCRFYEQEDSTIINCLMYAFDCSLSDCLDIENYLKSSYNDMVDYLEDLDEGILCVLGSKCTNVTDQGGINVELNDGEWLVAMRVGIKYNYYGFYYVQDYHFWYRTASGRWANKHGSEPSIQLPTNDLPTNNSSSGWSIDNGQSQFYTSDIYYYRVSNANN
ncbi:MAG: DNRLRE domain-containing protein [Clostridia bacterium]|nr:DNRLRE domain-containing protein [Clostridia bacterium]